MVDEVISTGKKARGILDKWLESCRRGGKLSRNTIAVGIVILDALRSTCPVERDNIVSKGGEIKGARSALRGILDKYGIPGFLKEATTRQVHQDGQRLLEALKYGRVFDRVVPNDRDSVLLDLIGVLLAEAGAWLARQHLKVLCSRECAPGAWIGDILGQAKGRSGGRVEQHLVGAKLSKAHPDAEVPVHAGTTADVQTGRAGDFQIRTTVYHVTAAPGEDVVRKCIANLHAGLHPVLLVPTADKPRAEFLVDHLEMTGRITVIAIEDFVAVNIIELSHGERLEFVDVLRGIVDEYNRRIDEVETDKSLKIDLA